MKKFLYGAAALSLALAFTGCDDEEDPIGGNGDDGCFLDTECDDGFACDRADLSEDEGGVCFDSCVIGEDQCAEGYVCNDAGACELDDIVEVEGYNKVLIVSRTDDDKDGDTGGDCRAGNPGPDIDYVRGESGGNIVAATNVSGAHGGFCGSAQMGTEEYPWAEPGVVLENLSIGFNEQGVEEVGYCAVTKSHEKYFFMGTGQPHTVGETIQENTGYLLVTLEAALEDGDLIEVGEVGLEPGADGEGQTCDDGPEKARPGDIYGLYLVHSDVTNVQVGDALVEPNFIHLGDDLIGLTKTAVILD